ncbi:MAG: threonine ammonia-lyase [Thermoanaerobaculia bacterium]|nr:threonine ammonia-lyase [Thermoanaerobaculia bacterium]
MIELDDILQARQRIADHVRVTPSIESPILSERCGATVTLKCETLQVTGSFKPRGALNRLLTLDSDERRRGVVAASAGNHAQGLAYAGGTIGVSSRIVMPVTTPIIKVQRTRAFGAEVELHGESFDDAYQRALAIRDEEDRIFVSPFDDEAVIAGQGTIGLEIDEQVPEIDAVLVPVGGGGMLAGLARALKSLRPGVRVLGVQTEASPALYESFRAGRLEPIASRPSIADGIAVKRPGAIPWEIVQRWVDDVLLVSEAEIEAAIFELLQGGKLVTEGAGAAAFAFALAHAREELEGQHLTVVLSGGNIDLNLLNRIIARSLVEKGRLVRLQLLIKDRPGALAALLSAVAELEANVLKVGHNRAFADIHSWETEVELTLETRDEEHIEELVAGLAERGFGGARRLSVRLAPGPRSGD